MAAAARRRRRRIHRLLLPILAGLALAALAVPASAHETKQLGPYHVAVGFGQEPAYAGQPNSVQVLLTDAAGKPVTDLGGTLQVHVSHASNPDVRRTMVLEPNFEVGEWGTPGDYRAFFIPSAPGDYTFHLAGKIHGVAVNQPFTSGPKTFSAAEDPAGAMFPVSRAPTAAQVALRLDRETARLDAATARQVANARHDAELARSVAFAAVLLAVVGLAVAVGVGRRRPKAAHARTGVAAVEH
jgi:hypothetical protein